MLTDSRNFDAGAEKVETLVLGLSGEQTEEYKSISNKLNLCYQYRLNYDYANLEIVSLECIELAQFLNDSTLLAISIGENVWPSIKMNRNEHAKSQLVNILSKLKTSSYHVLYAKWKVINLIGEILTNMGKQKECLEYMVELVKIAKHIGEAEYISRSLNNLAITYEYSGYFSEAVKAYTEALQICEEIGDDLGTAFTRGNMGFISMYQGKWDDALDKFTKTKEYFLGIKDIQETMYWQNNIAKLYLEKGEYWSAKTLLEENIAMLHFYGLEATMVYPYFDYFLVSLQLDMEDDMNETYEIIREIASDNPDNKLFAHYSLLCSAILLRKTISPRDVYVEDVLDFLINEDIVDIEVVIIATINRCELYLADLHKDENEDEAIVSNILHLISNLEEISLNNQMYPLLVLSKIIASQFLAVTGQFQESLDILTDAIQISNQNGLSGLLTEANKQKGEIEKEFMKIYDRLITTTTVKDRLADIDLDIYMERIKNFRLIR